MPSAATASQLAPRPLRAEQDRGGEHAQKADRPAQDGERDRIGIAGQVTRDRRRHAAETARDQGYRNADPLAHPALMRFELACGILPGEIVPATTSQVLMSQQHDFAASLREWRKRKGHSQLELAGRADISQRHLSFLELGRAAPSRDMVIRLAAALEVPLRQQNALLVAAGFAPVWRQTDLAAPELAQIRHALDFILAQQEPFPAVVVDRHWNLLLANAGAVRLVEFLVGPLEPGAPSIWPTLWSLPACCGPTSPIGPRWPATSFAASRPTP